MLAEIEELKDALSEQVCCIIEAEFVDGTYVFEAEDFVLSFTCEEGMFVIRNLEVCRSGLGTSVVDVIHEYCDEYRLDVRASNVRSTAVGFWVRMGYEESSELKEFFRIT